MRKAKGKKRARKKDKINKFAKLKEEKENKWSQIFAYAHAPETKKPIRINQCRKSFLARLSFFSGN